MWQEFVHFNNDRKEKLSGVLHYPEQEPVLLILLLGPHPHLGGDMNNNVVSHLSEQLEELQSLILRFDYHGNGESEITLPDKMHLYDYYENLEQQGQAEPFIQDCLAAWNYLLQCAGKTLPTILIGYSFGGYLALRIHREIKVNKVLAIASPFHRYPKLDSFEQPIYYLNAGQDFLDTGEKPSGMIESTVAQADHFFRGMENKVADWVLSIIKEEM